NDLRTVRVVNRAAAKNASPLVDNIEWEITTARSNYEVGDNITVKYAGQTVEDGGSVTAADSDGKILSVFIPTSKIIAYAKSINQYPDLGSSWRTTVTSRSCGVSAVITLGKIISESTVLLTEHETAHEEMTKTEFQTALAQYKMPGIAAAYPGELGNQLEIEIVSKAAFDKGVQLTIYPSGGQRASTATAVFGYGPQTDTQYAIIVRRDGAVVESAVLSTSR
ncbi:hypothetical protein, partial [Xanthomonas campestris]|uniref:hypothetical protein n=1 Tax=Xanthomonas campestris TaxID=339 RepID=UPI004039E49B